MTDLSIQRKLDFSTPFPTLSPPPDLFTASATTSAPITSISPVPTVSPAPITNKSSNPMTDVSLVPVSQPVSQPRDITKTRRYQSSLSCFLNASPSMDSVVPSTQNEIRTKSENGSNSSDGAFIGPVKPSFIEKKQCSKTTDNNNNVHNYPNSDTLLNISIPEIPRKKMCLSVDGTTSVNNVRVTNSMMKDTDNGKPQHHLHQNSNRSNKLALPALKKTTKSLFSNHPNNYLKGCKWSPDGLSLVTCSVDKVVRIFNVPDISSPAEQSPSATHTLASAVYDFVWNPLVDHLSAKYCNMLVTCKDNPIHLIDSFSGQTIASYTAFSQVESLLSAFSVCYLSCDAIVGGYCKQARIFNINRPGRESSGVMVGDAAHQNNNSIVSCIARHPTMSEVFAAGCYNTTLALYTTAVQGPIMAFYGPEHGITQVMFSKDGTKLYAGCRMEEDIYCFDTRNTGQLLKTFSRDIQTNQRIFFDINKSETLLVTGNHNGDITLHDLTQTPNESVSFRGHDDTVNGVSFHPHWNLLATCSGRRHFNVVDRECEENSLKIWASE